MVAIPVLGNRAVVASVVANADGLNNGKAARRFGVLTDEAPARVARALIRPKPDHAGHHYAAVPDLPSVTRKQANDRFF